MVPKQNANLSKGQNSTKRIKKCIFKYRPTKEGKHFSSQRKKKKGRKRIKTLNFRESNHGVRNCDNMLRKIKSWIISDIIKFINEKLKEENKNRKKNRLRLYTILKDQSYNIKIDYNIELLGKKMDEILSEQVSVKTKKKSSYNTIIINQIKKEKYDIVIDILNLTFLQCINHYIKKESLDCLKGFEEGFNKKREKISNYEDRFLKFVNNIKKYFYDKNFRIEMNNPQKKGKENFDFDELKLDLNIV